MLKQSGNGEAALKVLPLSDVFFPYITSSDTPKDAVQAKQSGLGGLLRLRPSRKQVSLPLTLRLLDPHFPHPRVSRPVLPSLTSRLISA